MSPKSKSQSDLTTRLLASTQYEMVMKKGKRKDRHFNCPQLLYPKKQQAPISKIEAGPQSQFLNALLSTFNLQFGRNLAMVSKQKHLAVLLVLRAITLFSKRTLGGGALLP